MADRSSKRFMPDKADLLAMTLGFALAAATVGPSHSEESRHGLTVQDLYRQCKSDEKPRYLYCVGYLIGVTELLVYNGGQGYTPGVCMTGLASVPPGEALVQIFVSWTEKHPERADLAALGGAALSLMQTWPCK